MHKRPQSEANAADKQVPTTVPESMQKETAATIPKKSDRAKK